MRQVSQSYRTGKLALVEVASPRAPSNGIMVETRASLISAGTERMIVDLAKKSLLAKAKERPDLVKKVLDKGKREGWLTTFDAVRTKLDSPIPLGYSLAGRVEEVGRSVTGFSVGDRVACAGAGYANHAELNAVPKNLAVHVPDNVTDEEASFVTVGAIGLQGVRLVKPELGDVVVVIGLGLIGQMVVSLLAAHGCKVVGVDIDPEKVKLALTRGATHGGVSGTDDIVEVVRAASKGYGADSVVITASSKDNGPLALAGDIARDRARISVVGLLPLEIPRKAYYEKELSVVVSRSYGPGRYDSDYEERGIDYPIGYVRWTERRNLEAVLYAIGSGRLDVKSLITHRFRFEDALDAYALITGEGDKREPHLGVVLTYPEHEKRAALEVTGGTTPTVTADPIRDSLGLAIIGTGSFATGTLLPEISKLKNVHVEAFASGRGLSAKHARDRYGKGTVVPSMRDALTNPKVGAVVIATRHDSHAELAITALKAGRHVFLEKPAALNREELARVDAAVNESKKICFVGFNRRFSPFAEEIARTFHGRTSGLVMNARINAGRIPRGTWVLDPKEGGGRIIGEGCHFIDLMSYWAGASPSEISVHVIGPGSGYEREDNVVIGLSFEDGSVGTLTYTAMGDPTVSKERYEIFSEGRVAVLDNFRTLAITQQGKTKTTRALRQDKGHGKELEAFVDACIKNTGNPIAWESIVATTNATFLAEELRARSTSPSEDASSSDDGAHASDGSVAEA